MLVWNTLADIVGIGNWRLNAGVEHALLEKLTFLSKASIALEDVVTHRSCFRRRAKAQINLRQSHVNAGTVPESKNTGTQQG